MRLSAFIAIVLFSAFSASAQKVQKIDAPLAVADTTKNQVIDPLRPAKAAFYSAILPGLGQVYNKRYWKVPLVYGAIGTSLYFYSDQNTKYKKVRDAYKRRLAGYHDDEYQYLDDQRLIAAQRGYKKNREYSLLFAVGFYVLNIVDANIDAHLKQFNVSDDLTLEPGLIESDMYSKPSVGLTLNYKF
ncbi:hypothetical protein HUK80_08900 [Flavobacterium sp. MAH-1]|uniref:DUF5683 domain-containing protein n=1 Tax=Flavobacterium agri TaxID=2743471 RepID=A0A7Y8Y1S1_9FLAO|nr:hypothetical protein [Flavobacterium agri]NYA71034.1 hypothetical protein [Flavobacterium agri]